MSSQESVVPAPPPHRASWLKWLDQKIPNERVAVALVLAMGALMYFPYLGTLGLWDCWEPHYGEVARAMIQREDYVYPYWESAYFFSKPALTLWLMALGLWVTGAENAPPGEPLGALAEWGARVPFALIAIGATWAVYRIGRQLRDRTTGVLAAVVVLSSPQFIFIGKQAMSDMPFVGLMTIGLACLFPAIFDAEADGRGTRGHRIAAALVVWGATIPQSLLIAAEMTTPMDRVLVSGVGLAGGVLGLYLVWRGTRHQNWLAMFYTFMGLAALAKGLAPLVMVGPMVLLYALFSFDFGVILRTKFYIGGLLFLLVAAPWYVVLTLFGGRDDEGLTFVERFWKHDNFQRVAAGVHGDRGGAGYFFEQVLYAMFPWSAVAPLAVGLAARSMNLPLGWLPRRLRAAPTEQRIDPRAVQQQRTLMFVLIWAVWAYVFFTVSLTKFHHYIFPAVPALALLVAAWICAVADDPKRHMTRLVAFLVLALFAVGARDLINDPQNLVNLFTYKYDREYPGDIVVRPWMAVILGLGMAACITLFVAQRKAEAVFAFVLMGAMFGVWISHHHFNMLAPHWSQAHLFKTYYQERKPNEPIYAFQLNWRGETFYSRNRVVQVKESGANERMRELVDQPGREFIIIEKSRFQSLKNVLSPDKRPKLEILDRSNNKFYLCIVQE